MKHKNNKDPLVIQITLSQKQSEYTTIKTTTMALVDSGASSNFLDIQWAAKSGLTLLDKPDPVTVYVIDGRPISSGKVTKYCPATISLATCDIGRSIDMDITNLGGLYPVILGVPWLRQNNPVIDWRHNHLSLSDKAFPEGTLQVKGMSFVPNDDVHPDQDQDLVLLEDLSHTTQHPLPPMQADDDGDRQASNLEEPFPADSSDTPEYTRALEHLVPQAYHDLLSAFSKKKADTLPPHRSYDLSIVLEEGKSPPYGPLYSLSTFELDALSEWLKENLAKGFIRASTSPAGAPILFVKKKTGKLRLCVDYRALNNITIKNRYPLPLIPEALDRLKTARIFTKMDLRGAYNLVRIKEGDEWKTAFRTRYGHFECLVMPFGLTNAPAAFQHFMNDVLRESLDHFVLVYLDDILVFSDSQEEHVQHVRSVLERLIAAKLYCAPEKCEFNVHRTEFLGFVVGENGVSMAEDKVNAVLAWPCPTRVKELQQFLGFANFYRRFISGYSRIITPLTKLLRKGSQWKFGDSETEAFDNIKNAFTHAGILKHFNPTLPTVIETDSSDYAISGILSQYHDKLLCPVAFMSKKMNPAERNYEIHDKELLAVVTAVKIWRHYLEGLPAPFTILTDHQALQYFQTSKTLTRRQARWSEIINHHKYIMKYRPGDKNRSDALSRRPDFAAGGKASESEPVQLLRPIELVAPVIVRSTTSELLPDIKRYQRYDPHISTIIENLDDPDANRDDVHEAWKLSEEGILLSRGVVYIPAYETLKVRILAQAHDTPETGHPGQAKTLELVRRNFYWPAMRRFINEYINSCDVCQRNKTNSHKPYGLLVPLPVATAPWQSLSMDHIVDLPKSGGCNAILVVVCRLTKMAHFIRAKTSDRARDLATQFLHHIFRPHGLPADIVSDRGSTFVSAWWKTFLEMLRVKPNLSTAFHPQTDGQTERINQSLEVHLRSFCDYAQDDWAELLPLAEFAHNSTHHSTIGMTPFYANYGHHPRMSVTSDDTPLPDVSERLNRIKIAHIEAQDAITVANERYAFWANKSRLPDPDFQPGAQVWLLRKHIKTTRPSTKLDVRKLGPFEVVEKVGRNAYRLALPPTMQIHPVVNVSLLEKHTLNVHPERMLPPPVPPPVVEANDVFEVEKIMDSRFKRDRLQHLVQWKGYPPSENSWTSLDNNFDEDFIRDFHLSNPSRPGYKEVIGTGRPRGARA